MATSRISHTITLLLIAFSTLPVSPIITQVPPISGVALGGVCTCVHGYSGKLLLENGPLTALLPPPLCLALVFSGNAS